VQRSLRDVRVQLKVHLDEYSTPLARQRGDPFKRAENLRVIADDRTARDIAKPTARKQWTPKN